MNRYTAIVVGLAAIALVAVTYVVLSLSEGGGSIQAEGPGGTKVRIQGEGPTVTKPGTITGEDLSTGGALKAENKAGGDVAVKRATSIGDMSLSTGAPEGAADPK